MSAAHTPGPWGIEQTKDMLWVGPLRPDGRKVDAVVVGLNIDADLKPEAALRQYRNARLIAAAPALLEACELLIAASADALPEDQFRKAVDAICAALSLAKGESA